MNNRQTTAGGVLDIDLDAIAANWRLLRAAHPAGAVAAVVKADGYGLGAREVATRLLREGCRHFFVAHLEEALAIADAVPGAMLAVLNGVPAGSEHAFATHGLLPVIGSLDGLSAWDRAARAAGRRLPALLHIDTGMCRLGLDARELAIVHDQPDRLDCVAPGYVMTHLVSSEDAADPVNERQRRRFAAACAKLPPLPRSIANSSGIFLGPDFASDLARPGAALYGVNPTPGRPNPMQAAVRLRARILQVRDIGAGESVGYNGTWRAQRPSRIATVGVGYADGWHRSRSGRGAAHFDGKPLPLVGRVSMDLTTYDVTDRPEIGPGGWLELIGPAHPVDAAAADAGTSGYEVLTSLGRRFDRVYHGA